MASLKTVAIFYDPSEAIVAKALLEQHGFTVFLNDSYYTQVNWGHIVALGGLRLTVPEPEAAEATNLLADTTPVAPKDGDPIDLCPNCSSENVFRIARWMSLIVAFCIGVAAIFVAGSKRRYCRHCKHRWSI